MKTVGSSCLSEEVKITNGSGFEIGDIVRVVCISDETVSKKFLGRIGKVTHFDYSCGCGQSYPDDPMIGVRFSNGKIEEFWREEIFRITKSA